MPYSFSFEVAGIRFHVVSSDELRLPDPWKAYEPFLRAVDAAPEDKPCVRLRVHVGAVPDASGFTPLFESDSWSLFRDGSHYWLMLAPAPLTQRPAWAARLASDFLSGDVYCDPAAVRLPQEAGVMFNPVLHRLDQLVAIHLLADRGGGIVHGTGVVAGHIGVIFAGRSGAGKTTLARCLQDASAASSWALLSDDRVVVREVEDGECRMYGTPWAGEAQIAVNQCAPLRGLAFLKHGRSDAYARLTPAESAAELLPVLSVPWYDADRVARMTDFCHRLVNRVPAWKFEFVPTSNVWKTARRIFQSLET